MKTQRSRPFISMICPRSDAGSVTCTIVFSLPLDSTRNLRSSGGWLGLVVTMATSTWKPSCGKRIWSAFSNILRAAGSSGSAISAGACAATGREAARAATAAAHEMRECRTGKGLLASRALRTGRHNRRQRSHRPDGRKNWERMSLVRVEHVFKDYLLGEQKVPALKDITLAIEPGVFLAIAGPSGSGKSTLLNLIGCIDTPTSGKISSTRRTSAARRPTSSPTCGHDRSASSSRPSTCCRC